MKTRPRALFVSHGGGPLPLLGDAAHSDMVSTLRSIAAGMPRPDAIVVVSAHWEQPVASLTASSAPPLIHDYVGFPAEAYRIDYPCPGSPSLAETLHRQLGHHGISARLDPSRGLDHGVFVPLKLMYPQADIPCVQLSLVDGLDAALHYRTGEALHTLADRKVLLIGSGFSFHNMKAFFAPGHPGHDRLNADFHDWLQTVCADPSLTEQQRRDQLLDWASAPGARFCHPREEHLLPLLVCAGAARGPCTAVHPVSIMQKQSLMMLW